LKPSTAYTSLGTSGWNQYDVLTAPGDISGDGIGDLIAQDRSNTVYRYYSTGNGTFGARVKISGGWSGCKGVF